MQKDSFRPDIQGLRALAVIAVVVFHISPRLLPGGYLGVDIFFVISGYLIIGMIDRDLKANSFSLLKFYSKRVKRLFPALFVTLTSCTVLGYFYLLPFELKTYSQSLFASLFYISNIFFSLQADYFDSGLKSAPLLHTWSLAVEEQFYFFYPLVALFLYKFSHRKILFFTILTISFLGSEILVRYYPAVGFYISPTRFWQFMAGGAVSLYLTVPSSSCRSNDVMSFVGLTSLIAIMFIYTQHTTFPGINALAPTIFTCVVLYFGNDSNWYKRLMNTGINQLTGNISYSLYLWHWPVIVFFNLYIDFGSELINYLFVFLSSYILGFLSWRFVEQASRSKELSIAGIRNPIIQSFLFSLALLALCLPGLSGLPERYSPLQNTYASYLNYNTDDYRTNQCFIVSAEGIFEQEKCLSLNDENKSKIALIGDSHAAHWYGSLVHTVQDFATVSQITASGCMPLDDGDGEIHCTKLMTNTYKSILREHDFDLIIISARWREDIVDRLLETLGRLPSTQNVIIFGPTLEFRKALPRLLATAEDTDNILIDATNYESIKAIDQVLSNRLKKEKIRYISIIDIICPGASVDTCKIIFGQDIPLAFDYGHLTGKAAIEILHKVDLKSKL